MLGRTNIGRSPNLTTKTVKSSATANVTYTPGSDYDGFSSVTVQKMNLTTKTVTPTDSSQTITPGTNYDGLSSVTVNAIPYAEYTTTAAPSSSTRITIPNSENFTSIKYFGIWFNYSLETFSTDTPMIYSISNYSNYDICAAHYSSGEWVYDVAILLSSKVTVTVNTSEIIIDLGTTIAEFNIHCNYYIKLYGKTS